MKVAALSMNGVEVVIARTIQPTKQGGSPFYSIAHGASGRGRWEVRIPLNNEHFPPTPKNPNVELLNDNFELVVLEFKRDVRGNPGLILKKGESDNRYLLLWDLSPGVNGTSHYKVEGDAKVLSSGTAVRDDGNKHVPCDCPIVLVDGPCALTWYRDGNVYGQPRAWCATYDGEHWSIVPKQEDWMRVLATLTSDSEEEEGDDE